ncbi:class I adenylate-forming enzyme family protein [Kibdelosporangium persicum]|uniref:AMP-dependent synthetase and ligase n=1 Tax=Kibdelosporangium persicum TaxID=2698649 RepID=A0ABX2F8P3_9PSEU|nr:class I adenylate-forming enzyme family protein [Kibdelosporangium persicum]NRN67291.1 AMP-dependent synthetase and ligase [Kibdelosporangium persicum]
MSAKMFGVDSVLTSTEFEQNSLRIAGVLSGHGVRLGDRVLLKADNSITYVSTLYALMHVGASVVLVDHQEKPAQTRQIREQARVKFVIADDDAPVEPGEPVLPLYALNVAAAGHPPAAPRLDFSAWSDLPDSLIMWSSGSTGVPKGVVKNGGRFLQNLRRNADLVGHEADDVLLPLLPFNHQYGLSMVLISWLVGCSLVIAPYRRVDRALRMAGVSGATVVDATPSTYRSILNIVSKRREAVHDFGQVRMLCSGAAPLDPGLVQSAVDVFGMPLLDSYGSTEMGNVAFATIDNPVGAGQTVDGLKIRITDDDGVELGAGQVGEIEVLDPDLMEGYLNADGDLDPVDRGWYKTNDFGYLDAASNLFIVGRKMAVHRNGHTLHPEIIEHELAANGCVAKIVALPSERRGSTLVFFVEDEQQRGHDHWRDRICSALPVFQQPNRVVVLERFPLNRNGKCDRKQLEALAADQG